MEDLIKALSIFLKYGNPRNPTICLHDKLIIAGVDPDDVFAEDIAKLDTLGFIISESDHEEPYFFSYRYGSA
jgi:hypothetical protein